MNLSASPSITALRPAVILVAGAFLAAMAAAAVYDARLIAVFFALIMLLAVGAIVMGWTVPASVAWLLLAGTTPEMWLGDLIGQEGTITAVVKLLGLALLGVCLLRYGPRGDPFNPGFAFLAMFIIGLLHGLYPAMTVMDSVRSLIGSAAPFAFCFARLSRRWCQAMITATIWVCPVILGFGALLALVHLRPLFADIAGVLRLQGSTHPAFLGGFAAAGIYAALVELYRDGRQRHLAGIVVNYAILVLSGARAPLAASFLVTGAAFFALRSQQFPISRRIPLVLGGMLLLPILVAFASGGSSIRLLNVLSSDARDLSGRDIIWPF